MRALKTVFLSAAVALGLAGAAHASEGVHIPTQEWPHSGIFGTIDKASAQRGFQVYKEVCAACHSMKLVPIRTLSGIGYNEEKIKKILGDKPLDSWDYLFDPKQAAKFKDCGIAVLDAPDEVLKIVLAWMGRDPNSQKEEDLAAAQEKLMAIRPYIRKIHSSQYIDDLATGELCLALGWSGDILQARDRAAEANNGVVVKYSIPKEGAIVWFDMLAIPADAKHPKNAHAFINYLLDPQVAANNSNFVNYANGNNASLPMVKDEVKNDPGIYPTPEVKAKLFPSLAYNEQFQGLMTRMWQKFQTGQ